MYFGRSSRFVGSSSLPISYCSLSCVSVACIFCVLNDISQYCILHVFRHLVNHIVPEFQFISKLYLTNQSYPKNMSILFKSVIIVSIFSLFLLISTSSSVYHVTSLFLVLFVLKTLNNLFIGSVFIFSSFASCLLIPVCVYSESTSTCSHNFFPFTVLIFVYMLSSLSYSLDLE